MSMSEFQDVKELVKQFTEEPELRKYSNAREIVCSDQKMDPMPSFENKRGKKSVHAQRTI